MDIYSLAVGSGPLVVSMPHSGLGLSEGLAARLTPAAAALPDTDWHIPQLYDFLEELDVSIIRANYSRYVVDLNRAPSNMSLYPGQETTDLVPLTLFDGSPVYLEGQEPDEDELEARRTDFHDPYHKALTELLVETRMEHGFALLWDAHSIADVVPRLFDGVLPDLNLGTYGGEACDPVIERACLKAMMDHEEYASIVNGRFRGGFITRAYGRPSQNVHAVQMELAQSAYMDLATRTFDESKATVLRIALKDTMTAALRAAENLYSGEMR
jgi:N-formylglutamate amidohydrolase